MNKNSAYWAKRKSEFIVQQMNKAEHVAQTMQSVYDKVEKYLVNQSEKIFEKYQRDYGLSEKQARELLKRSGVDVMTLKRELQNGIQTEEVMQILDDMDSAAYADRLKKLIQSQEDIDQLMKKMYSNDTQLLTTHLKHTAQDSYLNTMDLIQQQSGVTFDFHGIDDDFVAKILNRNWSGKHFSQAIWDNHAELGQTLKEEYLVNYLTGRSQSELSKVIADKFDVEDYKARRLVRTESTFVNAEMEAVAYEEADIDEYEYLSVLDNRTSSICRKHDKKIYKVKDRRAGVNYPPMHVFCRATTIAHFSDDWVSDKAVRDKESMVLDDFKEKTNDTLPYFNEKVYNGFVHSDTAEQHANRLLNDIAKVEPSITKDMQNVVGNGNLAGLEFRKKTADSLSRKIKTDSEMDGISLSEAAKNINDALRYTTVFNSETFSDDYAVMKDKLINLGYQIVKVKNTWITDSVYKGVNTVLEKDGVTFEMQYHTQESFELKNGELHELYEERRTLTTDKKRKLELDKKMLELSSKLMVPNGIEKVK